MPRASSAQVETCAKEDIPPLAAAYGPAEIDKAILDALLRGVGVNFFDGMAREHRRHRCAIVADLGDDEIAQFLASRRRRLSAFAIRHTVGLDDKVEGEGGVADAKENAGARYFKLKLNGDPEHDAARLIRIGGSSRRCPMTTGSALDANEQYADLAALAR